MNFIDYEAAAMRTAPAEQTLAGLVYASLGMVTEVGEFVSEVKRMSAYGKVMSPEMHAHMVEEVGDALWYLALAANHLHTPLATIARLNIEKLTKRFPEKFDAVAAEARADKGGLGHRES